jgi:hypothetical protein
MAEADKTLEELSTTHALEYYKNHCEFLGYSVEEEDEFSITCRHPRKDFLRLILLDKNTGVMAQIVYAFPERFQNNFIPLYMYANELNRYLLFTKTYINIYENKPHIIVLNSVLEGEYSRQNFAIFMDNIGHDMIKFHSYPKTHDIWLTQDEAPF